MGQPRLAYNGGPTQTVRPLVGSPAIDQAGPASLDEVQGLVIGFAAFPPSGEFTLTFNGQTTSELTFDATAAEVQAALNALASIGGVGGSVVVAKSGNAYIIAFRGALGGSDQPLMTATGTGNLFPEVQPRRDGGLLAITDDQRGQPRPFDLAPVPNAPGGNGSDIGAFELVAFANKPAVWRAGTWLLRNTLTTGPADLTFSYGLATDKPLMCDWDGDGDRTPGVFRDGAWFLRNTNTGGVADVAFNYGLAGDIPICGDWNGDGVETVGVVRVQGGQVVWYLRNSNTTDIADMVFAYGLPGDIPLVGDWNGDGQATPGVVRGGTWYLRNSNSSGNADLVFLYAIPPGDRPITGDWNGDGRGTVGVTRGALWLLRNSNTGGVADLSFNYGAPGDTPLVWR